MPDAIGAMFQARPRGWLLDDVVLTSAGDGRRGRAAVSVRAAEQFGATSPPADFVRLAWSQLLGLERPTPSFDEDYDYLCLACPIPDKALRVQLKELLGEAAAQDPNALADYLRGGAIAKLRRSLYAGFACPTDLAVGRSVNELFTGRLLRRLRFWDIDFRDVGSASEDEALVVCQEAVGGGPEEATLLWDALCRVADELRPRSGTTSLPDLVIRVRDKVRLRAHPDYKGDLERLSTDASRQIAAGKHTLGTSITLDLSDLVASVEAHLSPGHVTMIHGPSGSAKSQLARRVSENVLNTGGTAIWLSGATVNDRGLGTIHTALALTHPLSEIIHASPHARRLLVIDGAEKLVSDAAFAEAAILIRSAVDAAEVLVTVTSAEAERLSAGLARAGLPQDRVRVEPVPRVTLERLLPHLSGHAELRRLAAKPEAAELLTRLKVADVLVTNVERLRATDTDAIVGEATMAEWFWSATVECAPNRTQRSAFLKRLATRLADESRSTMPDDEIGGDEVVADELVGAGILARSSGRLGFEHDLFGEWTRYHALVAKRDRLSDFLKPRRGQVSWHGAVRLVGSKQVERPAAPGDWRSLMAELEDDGAPSVHGDLLLEALCQAWGMRPPPFVGADALLADDGRLLVRLLKRVLVSGSSAAEGLSIRVPRLALWAGPTRFVLGNVDRCVEVAPEEVCQLLAHWVAWAPAEWDVTKAAAAEVRRLALRYRGERGKGYDERHLPRECARPLYEACLRGFPTDSAAAGEVLLTLAERRNPPNGEPRQDREHLGGLVEMRHRLPDGTVAMSPACELGPFRRVDDAFQSACADMWAMDPVMQAAPVLAAELVVATNVGHPKPLVGYRSDDPKEMFGRRWNDFYPPMWFRGVFLPLLRSSPGAGLRVITMLCRHLVECFLLRARLEGNDGDVGIELEVDGQVRSWPGNRDLFLAYQDSSQVPDVLVAALMALEKYLYERLDEGSDVGPLLAELIVHGSAPVAGVLSAVALYRPALVRGPLAPLLTSAEVLAWDWERSVQRYDLRTAGIAWSMKGPASSKAVHEWISMPHRGLSLLDLAKRAFIRDNALQLRLSTAAAR